MIVDWKLSDITLKIDDHEKIDRKNYQIIISSNPVFSRLNQTPVFSKNKNIVMQAAFLDTNVIHACRECGLTGCDFADILKRECYTPIIGPCTIYENARCYDTEPEKMVLKFQFIKELDPYFSFTASTLFSYEYLKLKGILINPFLFLFESNNFKNEVNSLSKGNISEELKKIIKINEDNLKKNRNLWKPEEDLKKKYKKFPTFDDRIKYILEALSSDNREAQESIKQLFQSLKLEITDIDLFNFSKNINKYPALRSYYFQQLYLDFILQKYHSAPSRDKFPDGRQVIEASFCDLFITGDKRILNAHGKFLNPDITFINIKDLL